MTIICKITANFIVEISRSNYKLNKIQINRLGKTLLSCAMDKLKSNDREYAKRIWDQAIRSGDIARKMR